MRINKILKFFFMIIVSFLLFILGCVENKQVNTITNQNKAIILRGTAKINIKFSEPTSKSFSVKVVPYETNKIEIEIKDENGNFVKDSSNKDITVSPIIVDDNMKRNGVIKTINDLPVGENIKFIIKAYNSTKLVASNEKTITIKPKSETGEKGQYETITLTSTTPPTIPPPTIPPTVPPTTPPSTIPPTVPPTTPPPTIPPTIPPTTPPPTVPPTTPPQICPPVPTNLIVTPTSDCKVKLTWEISNQGCSSSIKGYRIYRDNNYITFINSNNFTDLDLLPNKSYSYSVETVDQNDKVSSKSTPKSVQFSSCLNSGIGGNVKDLSGTLISGATVILKNTSFSSTTNSNGWFTIDDVPANSYNICASASAVGCPEQCYQINLYSNTSLAYSDRFKLNCIIKQTGSLNITGDPPGANIYIDGGSVQVDSSIKTPATINNLLVGTHRISLTKAGYAEYKKDSVIINKDQTTYETYKMACGDFFLIHIDGYVPLDGSPISNTVKLGFNTSVSCGAVVNRCEIWVDGKKEYYNNGERIYEYNFNSQGYPDGQHKIYFKAFASDGRSQTEILTYNFENKCQQPPTMPPNVKLLNDGDGTYTVTWDPSTFYDGASENDQTFYSYLIYYEGSVRLGRWRNWRDAGFSFKPVYCIQLEAVDKNGCSSPRTQLYCPVN